MISGISGNTSLYKMIAAAGSQAGITPTGQGSQDPLNVFGTVDQDGSNSISESEYTLLAEAIQEVTGTEMNSSFSDFDQDGDGQLSAEELKMVLEATGFAPPPPPAQEGAASFGSQDPLNVFGTVDQDGSNSISESEFDLLTEAVQQVTGTELSSSFSDFDQDGDGELSTAELKLALDEAGFKAPPPPPPPPEQVLAAYDAQASSTSTDQVQASAQGSESSGNGFGPDVLSQVLDYIRNQSENIDILA